MSTTIGIILLPDSHTEAYVKRLSRGVRGNQISFNSPPFVHLSLLHMVVQDGHIAEIKRMLEQVGVPAKPVIACYEVTRKESGWCFVEVKKNRGLVRIQRSILPIAAMRATETSFTWCAYASEAQKRAHKKFGYANVGTAWAPHFTFGVAEPRTRTVRRQISRRGTLERLALVQIEEHGTAGRLLYEQQL